MPKNMLEDIKPLTRKPRARNHPLDHETHPVIHHHAPTPPPPRLPRELPFEPSEPRGASRALWYVAVILIVGFLFSLSFLFERAHVTVTPKTMPIAFDASDTFTAEKDSTTEGAIVYTVMNLDGDETMRLPATDSKQESIPATGRVVLFNEYSAAAYKLVKSTRLQSPDGRIYRITSAATIPGYTKTAGGILPGAVEVTVVADVPGEASNLDNSDFTVPGLAGTAQATKIYGRTKTAITGGISGLIYSIPEDAANAALGTLTDKLKASLIAKAKVQVPDGYIFYDGAAVFSADDSIQVPYSREENVPLALHGTLTAYLIKEDTLVHAIAERAVSQYESDIVTVPKISALTLATDAPITATGAQTFEFTLTGQTTVIWTVNTDMIRSSLAGRKKGEFEGLLSGVPGVDRAEVTLKPFWKRAFPKDQKRITVTVTEL